MCCIFLPCNDYAALIMMSNVCMHDTLVCCLGAFVHTNNVSTALNT